MLKNQFGFDANAVTVTQVVANLGAMTGGTVVGYLSQSFGRRLSIIVICVIGGALLYPCKCYYTTKLISDKSSWSVTRASLHMGKRIPFLRVCQNTPLDVSYQTSNTPQTPSSPTSASSPPPFSNNSAYKARGA